MKKCAVSLFLLTGIAASGTAAAQSTEWTDWMRGWKYGLGTGLFGLNMTGQFGYSTPFGSPEISGTLKSSQFKRYADSAYGFTAFATKDKWTVLWRYSHMKLDDTLSARLLTGEGLAGHLGFKGDVGELDGIYQFATLDQHQFGGLAGVRYTHQELNTSIPGSPNNSSDVSAHWIDGVFGLTHQVPVSPTVTWHNRVDLAAGADNWAYHANTGLRWGFAKNWAADFYGDFQKTDYERNDRGQPGWYLYRVKEFGVGAAVNYSF
jgi:hypothetical protein